MHLVLDDRTADADGAQCTVVIGFLERCGICSLIPALQRIERDHARVLVADECIAAPHISARLRGGGDDGAGGLLILRLEVLSDDAVLLHRTPWERITAACVLT